MSETYNNNKTSTTNKPINVSSSTYFVSINNSSPNSIFIKSPEEILSQIQQYGQNSNCINQSDISNSNENNNNSNSSILGKLLSVSTISDMLYLYNSEENYITSILKVIDNFHNKLFLYPICLTNSNVKNKEYNLDKQELLLGEYSLCKVIKVQNGLALIKPEILEIKGCNHDISKDSYITIDLHYLIYFKAFSISLISLHNNNENRSCIDTFTSVNTTNTLNIISTTTTNTEILNSNNLLYLNIKNFNLIICYLNCRNQKIKDFFIQPFKVIFENHDGILLHGINKDLSILLDLENIIVEEKDDLEIKEYIISNNNNNNNNDEFFVLEENVNSLNCLKYVQDFTSKVYIDINHHNSDAISKNNDSLISKGIRLLIPLLSSYINTTANNSKNSRLIKNKNDILSLFSFYLIKYQESSKFLIGINQDSDKDRYLSKINSELQRNFAIEIKQLFIFNENKDSSCLSNSFSNNLSNDIDINSNNCSYCFVKCSSTNKRIINCSKCQLNYSVSIINHLIKDCEVNGITEVIFDQVFNNNDKENSNTCTKLYIILGDDRDKVNNCLDLVLIQLNYLKMMFNTK